jgi:hypothetical protein
MNLKLIEMGGGVRSIYMNEDRDNWLAVVNTVMNHWGL